MIARFRPDGSLDTAGFGKPVKRNKLLPTVGYVVHDIASKMNDQPNNGVIALQDDGKILVGGWSGSSTLNPDYTIARYHGTDGALDTTFGDQGVVTQTFSGFDVLQLLGLGVANGRIYISGRGRGPYPDDYDTLVACYTLGGTLDPTFGTGGLARSGYPLEDNGSRLAIQADGKIVVAANIVSASLTVDIVAFRFTIDGSLDASFDGDGMSVPTGVGDADGRAVAIDPIGDLFIAGFNAAEGHGLVAKYNP